LLLWQISHSTIEWTWNNFLPPNVDKTNEKYFERIKQQTYNKNIQKLKEKFRVWIGKEKEEEYKWNNRHLVQCALFIHDTKINYNK
jgi:hypothetical protein